MLLTAPFAPPMAAFPQTQTTAAPNPDVEPDDQWKRNLRKQIEEGLQDMFDDAKNRLAEKLKEAPVDAAERDSLAQEHSTTMKNIRSLAAEQYAIALERERQERLWLANVQMAPGWNEVLVKEQQSILQNIQKGDSQSEESIHRASPSPTDDRGQLGARANPDAQRETSHISPIPHPPERPSERWSDQPLVEEPEEMDMSDGDEQHAVRPGGRTFERTTGRPIRSSDEVDAWRLPASSPPKSSPEIWKPSTSPAVDAAASRSRVQRRSSAASIGSIGSTNYRSSIPTQIPESPGDSLDMAGFPEWERPRSQVGEQERKPSTKAREREWQGQVRTAGETSNLHPEEHVVPSVRAAEGQSRMCPPPSRPITNRQSSQNLRAETSVPIPPSRPAEPQAPMHMLSSAITNSSQNLRPAHPPTPVPISPSWPLESQSQVGHVLNRQSPQNLRAEEPPYFAAPVPISPSRPAESHSRAYRALNRQSSQNLRALNRQSSQNLRPEEPAYLPTPALVSPSQLAESQSRIYSASSARPIPRKRPSQSLVFDEDPSPASAGLTSTSWLESPGPYGPVPPLSRSITSKPSFIFDDSGRQASPTAARVRPTPSGSPADSRFERDFPRSAHSPDDEFAWQMRLRTSNMNVRYEQQDRHHIERHRYAEDSDEEYENLEEQSVADVHRAEGTREEQKKRRVAARLREQAMRLEDEASETERKREEDHMRAVEEEKRQERALLREEELKRKEEDAKRKEEDAKRKEEDARRKEEDARRLEEAVRRKEADARRKEEEAKRKEEEAKRKEQEAKVTEAEAKRKEADARRKEEAAHQKEEETRKKEVEIRKREEQVKRREEELNRREAEAKLKDKEKQDLQQEEFRKREEEIRRRADQRKGQDSTGSYSESRDRAGSTTYPSASPTTTSPPRSGLNRSGSTATNATDRSSTSSSSRSSNTSSTWSSSTRASSTSSTQPSSAARPPTTPTSAKSGGGPQPPSPAPMSESDWARRQAEQAKKQQEQFRLEQERLERDRQAKAGKIMTKEEVIQLFETHHRQWAQIPSYDTLHWDSFPWPTLRRPFDPDELTTTAIGAYVLSPHYPGDAAKSSKDRVKEHIKRWHPDRFETKLLPKVIEGEREKVKQGAGLVARCLNDLLTRSNVSNMFS